MTLVSFTQQLDLFYIYKSCHCTRSTTTAAAASFPGRPLLIASFFAGLLNAHALTHTVFLTGDSPTTTTIHSSYPPRVIIGHMLIIHIHVLLLLQNNRETDVNVNHTKKTIEEIVDKIKGQSRSLHWPDHVFK